jgi:hypothetical protein
MRIRHLPIAVIAVLAFCSCNKIDPKDMNVVDSASAAGGDTVTDNGTLGTGGSPDQLIKTCADAKASGKLVSEVIEVDFEDPGVECNWGHAGNLSIKDGYIRGRVEQVKSVDFSNQGTVCNLEMVNMDEQNFYYDDNIFLNLNGFVLASTSNFSSHLQSQNGLYKYSWANLVKQDAQNNAEDTTADKQYCAGSEQGQSSCSFPQTESYGSVQLQFEDKLIQTILGMTSASKLNLTMVTTGDNDSTDCQHVPLHFKINVQYFK